MAASHAGEDRHVRTLQGRVPARRRQPVAAGLRHGGAQSTRVTAARLARDGEEPGPIRHQCSGFHAASLLLSAGTPTGRWRTTPTFDHPSQKAVRETVARLFGTSVKALQVGIDDCGLATYAFPLADVARAFALLADPAAATVDDPVRARIRAGADAHPRRDDGGAGAGRAARTWAWTRC